MRQHQKQVAELAAKVAQFLTAIDRREEENQAHRAAPSFSRIAIESVPLRKSLCFDVFRNRTQAEPVLVLDRNAVESSRSTSTISLSTSTMDGNS